MTKKNPGVQCSKCNKWLHGTCASITTEQLTALFTTDSVDWKCRGCTGGAKPKRLSCILPDHDEEDNTDTEPINNNDAKQILSEIRREVREVIRQELQNTLQFYSDKIDEYEEKIKGYEITMKSLENKCMDTKNTCKNLALKNDVLEQKLNAIEQNLLANNLEICGIKEEEMENIKEIANKICTKITQNPEDITKVYRKKIRRSNTTNNMQTAIVVTLRDPHCREKWLESAKKIQLTAKDLGRLEDSKIYLRESLAPATAFLLWKAKSELKETDICKYVWCKNGLVLVRKHENDKKTYIVRSEKDIERLVSELQK